MRLTHYLSSLLRITVLLCSTVMLTVAPARAATVKPTIYAFNTYGPTTINRGETVVLNWSVGDATTLSITPDIGVVTGTEIAVKPQVTTTYTLTATNNVGSVTKTRKVTVVVPPAIQTFAASPATITSGNAASLSWSAPGATSFSIAADTGTSPGSVSGSSLSVKPAVTTNYTLTARNSAGTDTRTVAITVNAPIPKPVIESFIAEPTTVDAGAPATLTWSVSGATSVSISPGIGAVTGSSVVVHPTASTTYKITATNPAGSVTKTATVNVNPPPAAIVSLTATPTTVYPGAAVTLTWQVTGSNSLWLSADNGGDPGSMNGLTSTVVHPAVTMRYVLTAWSPVNGSVAKEVFVTVVPPPPAIASFTATPAAIKTGETTQLTWSVTGANGISLAANVGASPGVVTGSGLTVMPLANTTYTLTAKNNTGTVTQTVAVAVTPTIAITSLTATPNHVNSGDAVTLAWTTINADSLWMSADNGGDPGSMNGQTSVVVHPTVTTRYVLTAFSSQFGTTTKSVIVDVGAPPPPPVPVINAFAASPATISLGGSTTLTWSVSNADTLSISPGLGAVTGTSASVAPTATTTYTLTATNSNGSVTRTATVTVTGPAAPTIGSFTALPAFIQAGASSVLNWSVSGADSLAIAADVGTSPGAVSGTSLSVTPGATTRYTLTATNPNGSSTAQALVTIYTPGNGGVSHPRIWITNGSAAALSARAAANDPAWIRLRNTADAYVAMPISYPDQSPSSGTINGGYQYMDYLEPATALALAYQVTKTVDPVRATNYAAKERELLLKLSDPIHHGVPTTDSGYSIRAYVPALALGYDWIYETLSDSDRAQIFTEINRWVASFDAVGFGRSFPNGNYFAGYYCAKALGALATEGENPNAAAMWNDWLNRLHFQMVQPYYAVWLSGGGAPDGWNYGPFETINMLRPIAAAFTAKGLDLIHHSAPFPYPDGHARWMTHFTWPDLTTVNDRGLIYEGSNPTPATAAWATQYAGLLRLANGDNTPIAQQFSLELRAKSANDRPESWAEFLFHDQSAPVANYRTALSLRTPGDGQVAMRSSWAPDAVWGAFQAGPYTGYQSSAEEYYDQGSLVIQRGGVQFLVNATGALLRHTPGTVDGDTNQLWSRIYDEVFQTQTDGVYVGRRLFNTYMAVRANGYWGQSNPNPGETNTTLSRFEDGGTYVLMRGVKLEEMYADNHPISGWTRTIAYLRPQLFVAYDRTSINHTGTDNWMAWHVAAQPVEQFGVAAGTRRFDVVDPRPAFGGNLFRGRVSTVLPLGHNVTTVDTFGRGKVYRLEVRPGAPTGAATWLTVFDASASASTAANVAPITAAAGNVLAGSVEGTVITLANGHNVAVVFSATANPIAGAVTIALPASATYCLLPDLAANTGYTATTSIVNGSLALTVSPGGPLLSSADGTLAFNVSPTGAVTTP